MIMQTLARSSRWLAAALSPEGLIESLSSSAEQFTGYSPQDLVGRPITQILADDTAFEIPKILSAAREWGHWKGVIVYRTRSGKSMEGRGVITSLSGNGDVVDGFLFLSNLHEMPATAECDNAVVGDIAATLRTFAHDMNNPLAVIMGFAQLLTMDSSVKGKVRADIEKLYSELQNVVRIVEKLHSYAISLHEKPSGQPIQDVRGQSA